jgi:hypothetical protein
MMRPFGIMLLATSLLAGCVEIFAGDPLEYPDAEQLSNDSMLRPLWNALQACSGRHRSFDAVDFFYVPHNALYTKDGIRALGQFFSGTNRIYVIEAKRNDPAVLRHEMMHALIRDIAGHPPEFFSATGRCGQL